MTLSPQESASAEGGHWAADPQAPLSARFGSPGAPEPTRPISSPGSPSPQVPACRVGEMGPDVRGANTSADVLPEEYCSSGVVFLLC